MEKLDIDELDNVAGGRGIYPGEPESCHICGKKSGSNTGSVLEGSSFGIGFCEVFYKDGMHKLCHSCYEKWCNGDLN